jgi:hypothetical protein
MKNPIQQIREKIANRIEIKKASQHLTELKTNMNTPPIPPAFIGISAFASPEDEARAIKTMHEKCMAFDKKPKVPFMTNKQAADKIAALEQENARLKAAKASPAPVAKPAPAAPVSAKAPAAPAAPTLTGFARVSAAFAAKEGK